MNAIDRLEKLPQFIWILVGFILIFGLGALDYETGYEISFSLFYLLPIALVVWLAGKWLGVTMSIVSAIVWLVADLLSGQHYSHQIIIFWNTAIRFGFFIIVTLLLASLKEALEHEKNLSRTDHLTGATSADFFYDLIKIEIDRFQRYQRPFSVVYIDLDNFKDVNDQFGHTTGDLVLRTVVNHTRNEMRKTDILARLGGDEFAILFPETDQKSVQVVVTKIQERLQNEVRASNWPVTLSMGAITFLAVPETTNELIKMVDDLMYTVKRNGKNAVRYSVYKG